MGINHSELTKSFENLGFDPLLVQNNTLFLLVRHRGCTFCRETLTALSQNQIKLEQKGYKVVVIHMGEEESSALIQEEFSLHKIQVLADPNRHLYKLFGARRGRFTEVLGAQVVKKGILSGALFKYGVGALEGDGFQLGGLYLLTDDTINCIHHPQNAADVEDWPAIIKTLP
jgi:hypothetical protein